MPTTTILWADDEIDLLKPQVMFLKDKGYEVTTVSNGPDAITAFKEKRFDVVLLDESMPGLSGLQTLTKIKEISKHTPVVMITKNEEENLMEEAIGSQIADYLIKPVKPQQILSSLKKLINKEDLVSEKTVTDYRSKFQEMFMRLQNNMNATEWVDFYKELIYWEIELDKSSQKEMMEVFEMQKREANSEFNKFVLKNYKTWMNTEKTETTPLLSHQILKAKLPQLLKNDKPTFLILIDNLRYDQWKAIEPFFLNQFKIEEEDSFFSILPTVTQYSRNAIFAGMTPLQIQQKYPDRWLNDDDDGGKNLSESFFLEQFLKNTFHEPIKHQYIKVTSHKSGNELEENIHNCLNNKLTVIVYNFVDMLSHARTEMEVLKELANDEAAYRSLAVSWFEHSPLLNAIKKLAGKDVNLLLTTDHGSVRVNNPSKCVGDRQTSTNIRYKMGKNLNFEEKDVLFTRNPEELQLPKSNLSSTYIFAKEDKYLVYPNNYNHFVQFFKDTFQHGGISLEEMVVPLISMTSK
jgi:DNA-binding response OmpR family regulator